MTLKESPTSTLSRDAEKRLARKRIRRLPKSRQRRRRISAGIAHFFFKAGRYHLESCPKFVQKSKNCLKNCVSDPKKFPCTSDLQKYSFQMSFLILQTKKNGEDLQKLENLFAAEYMIKRNCRQLQRNKQRQSDNSHRGKSTTL